VSAPGGDRAGAPLLAGVADGPVRAGPLAAGFVLLNAITGTAGGVMHLAVPLAALRLEATSAQVGLLRGIAGVGMLLAVVPVGILVDRLGSRRVFRAGALAGVGVAAAMGLARSPLALALLMGLEGLLAPLRFTALHAAFLRHLPTLGLERAGWLKGSMSIGLTLVGPLLGGALVRSAGSGAAFAAVIALHLLGAAVAGQLALEAPVRVREPRAGGLRRQLADLATYLRDGAVRGALAAELAGAAGFSAFSAFVVVVAVRELGAGPLAVSQILVVEGAAYVATAFLAGGLAARPAALRRIAGAVAAAGALGTALATGPASLGAAGGVIGVGLALLHVLGSSRLGALRGARGKLSSLFQVAAGVGMALGPLASAAAAHWLPAHAALLVFVPAFLLLALTPHTRSSTMALERSDIPQYLHDTPFIILSTVDERSGPATRTLASFAADGLTVYFSTSRASDKVRHLGANPHVSVLFQHDRQELPSFRNVEIRGKAEPLSDDGERGRAIALIGARNPRFRQRAEKGELGDAALFRVTPQAVKVIDFSRGVGPAAVTHFTP
jgi:MFS family permease